MYAHNPVEFFPNPKQTRLDNSETTAIDLSTLTAMARRVEEVRKLVEPQDLLSLPIISLAAEQGEMSHRVVIYRPLPVGQQALKFVGFVSKRHSDTPAAILASLVEVDKTLVIELASHPALLNYSSLELADGIWYNLVIFAHDELKNEILALTTHQYAVYELAPSYYQWIRLHHGIIAGGSLSAGLTLHKTKYYTFHTPGQQPTIQVQTYDQVVAMELGEAV